MTHDKRQWPAAQLMRDNQDAPATPYPRRLGIRQRGALARMRAAGAGLWVDVFPHEAQAVRALAARGLCEVDADGTRARIAPVGW